jgi:predicted type IV restriction endonuclease
MSLESLYEFIGMLRERIQQHAAALRQSEMLTRYALIDPLLRELGWDTEDPNQVRPEYRPGPGAADYALLSGGKPIIMVEAKKLDMPLQDGLMQSINYCLMDGTAYFAVTDGRR